MQYESQKRPGPVDHEAVVAVAHAFRRLTTWFVLEYLALLAGVDIAAHAAFLRRHAGTAPYHENPLLPTAWFVAMFVAICAIIGMAVYAHRLTRVIGLSVAWAWGLGALIPCINAVMFLMATLLAAEWCRSRGVAFGLFGPTREAMAEVRAMAAARAKFRPEDREYVRNARVEGRLDEEIVLNLIGIGWSEREARWLVEEVPREG
jgi:hypothetical protein